MCSLEALILGYILQYIGSLDVAKPKTRSEIIVAMRNIRVSIICIQVDKVAIYVVLVGYYKQIQIVRIF